MKLALALLALVPVLTSVLAPTLALVLPLVLPLVVSLVLPVELLLALPVVTASLGARSARTRVTRSFPREPVGSSRPEVGEAY